MGAQMMRDPASVPALMRHVGPAALAEWLGHMGALGAYTSLHALLGPSLHALAGSGAVDKPTRYRVARLLDALEYGSGADYKL